ncbi:47e9216a-7d77-491e-90fd-ef96de7f9f3f [Thermothielavioides terrestris]|uniref:47e9216a-7d77-491e-90fd-ef96de7f9f3f n=1 Tax=Thermothielavioides terrestris TaxID=2587410 RepID=A0A446BFB9_9PEZI|nr:47e9216a-7d77-491e-90fd-ef96de7f9f3f [Thermothielavioides terrestris]
MPASTLSSSRPVPPLAHAHAARATVPARSFASSPAAAAADPPAHRTVDNVRLWWPSEPPARPIVPRPFVPNRNVDDVQLGWDLVGGLEPAPPRGAGEREVPWEEDKEKEIGEEKGRLRG